MKSPIILLLAMTLSVSAFAVEEEKPETISDQRLLNMQQQLQLSDEQLVEMRQIREEGGSKKDIRSVLTEEQQQQLQELKKQRQKKQSEK